MQLRIRLAAAFLLVAGLAVPCLPQAAESQYFGRNKVQYQDFDFTVLETEHFEIYYHEEEERAAVQAGRMAERWYARLSRVLDHDLRGKQPIVLYGSHPAFEQTNAVFGQIGETTGGVTEPLKRRIVLPLGMSMKESDHVLGHEIVHAFQFDLTGQGPDAVGADVPVALRMPLWFIEGMAEYLSIGSEDAFTAEWLRGAVMADELPSWGDLGKSRYFPYRYGHALWSYVGGRFGDQAVGLLLKAAAQTGNMKQGFVRVLGVDTDTLIADWHAAIRDVQGPVLEATEEAHVYGRALANEEMTGTRQNLAPSLSPDGELMVFASEKNLFSIELFVADAATGEVLRKLTETARDPHFESLQWVGSSGEWSPDGRLYALAGINKGRPVISLYDPRSGDRVREIKLRQFGEIFNPTWSPDGERIAFSAQTGGFTDLHVLDLESGDVRTLTNDPWADVHPNWSPDGERIAFVTDRFGSNLDLLVPGDYRLATIDPETGAIEALPAFEEGKHINPQWGPGGEDLYFLSDRSGITNLYRLDVATGALHQVTNLKTGISGISGLSPSLSVARDTDLAVFSVHGEGNFVFEIYAMDDPAKLAGTPVGDAADLAGLSPRTLPPPEADRGARFVDRLLEDEELGLASAVTFEKRDYDPSLSLDFLGRPSLAVGSDQFGFFVGGGGSAFFSDMLGNRNLSTLVQVDGSTGDVLKSTALFTSYVNRSNRLNWGIVGGQIPQISRSFNVVSANSVAGPVFISQDFRFWQINRELSGVIEFPFNRAQRIEFSGGVRQVEFASEVRQTVFSAVNGQVLSREDFDFPALDTLSTLNQGRASAALVYDNTIFGATAPMVGQRYRLEVSPTAGSVDYYTLLGDFRKYVMPVRPFTIAGRVMHLGRYGADAEDHRLQDYFIGYPSMVRGYEPGSFSFRECPPIQDPQEPDDVLQPGGDCPAFDQLIGSRVGVMNAELRLPFLGGIGIIQASNVPPIDLIGFFDAGIAWTRDIDPTFLNDGPRQFVRSVGVGARLNLFGLAVFELDYVNPLDRELKDWYWDFSVTPGF